MDVNVSLDAGLAKFVEGEVAAGRYASPGDVLRAALQIMEGAERDDAGRLRALQEAWREGVDSGDAGELDISALKAEARERSAVTRP